MKRTPGTSRRPAKKPSVDAENASAIPDRAPRLADDWSVSHVGRYRGAGILLLAAGIAVLPLLIRGPACGSDFGFHFGSWLDAEHSMTMGVLYPHWANSPNFGAGEPRFVFYPPLIWMCGAILGMILPWTLVPVALFFVLLAATGVAVRALARESLPDGPATLAGCSAIFLGYALFNVYKRCDFPELAGGFWIPLVLLYALRSRPLSGGFWRRVFDGSAAPLALVVAGAWLSNGPVGLMATYLLAAAALASAFLSRSFVPILRAAVGAAVGIGLAADYLLPAVWERGWASIQYAFTLSHFVVENSWLFAHHADPGMFSHDMLLQRVSWIAVEMVAIAVLSGVIAWLRGAMPGERRWWIPLALIPPAVLFLLVPISLPVWNLLPEFRLLQFPWRWLLVLEAPMAIFFAAAVWPSRRNLVVPVAAGCAALFVGISVAADRMWFVDCANLEAELQLWTQNGTGMMGRPEYSPPGVHYALMDRIVHGACLLAELPESASQGHGEARPSWDGEANSCTGDFRAAMYLPEHKGVAGITGHAGYLILRLRYYPAWSVKVNGRAVTAVAESVRGLMAVPVPQGDVRVTVDWTTTSDVIAGRWMSAILLVILLGLFWIERQKAQPQLS